MTQLLQRALKQIEVLPDDEQDGIANLILCELEDDAKWHNSFARSSEKLAKLSAKVDDDIRAGRVSPIGIDEL